MMPAPSIDYIIDIMVTHAKELSQFCSGKHSLRVEFAYLNDLFAGELGIRGTFAARMAPLFYLVACVVLRCAKKEMRGTDTKLAIAVMAHQHAVWYWAVHQFVGDTVTAMWARRAKPKESVARTNIMSALPEPASIKIAEVYLRPEAKVNRLNGVTFGRAVIVRNGELVARRLWGMLGVHGNSSFLCQAQGGCNRRWALLLLSPIIPQEGIN